MKYLYLSIALIAAVFTSSARAETINCTEITAIPMVITVQGVYCLKGNLATSLTVGNIIDIQTNNVTIDFNGFKLGGLAAGLSTTANGVFAQNRKNITLRNGSIRGFLRGIQLDQSGVGTSSGHLIEDMLLDGNRLVGVRASGSGLILRRNRVVNTGAGTISTIANGIQLSNASKSVIVDNVVSGTTETAIARGILVFSSTDIEVRNNSILGLGDATQKLGIDLNTSTEIMVIGNRIIGTIGNNSTAITNSSISVDVNCINNTVAGYNIGFANCQFLLDNVYVP